MQISLVKIKNYRGIKEAEFEPCLFTCAIGENNAGKSSILLSISLFFSGTTISKADYFDAEDPIEIELTFSHIDEKDIRRIAPEHRDRIREIINDGVIKLTRRYPVDSKSEMLCSRLAPKESKFNKDVLDAVMKGKKGKDISNSVIEILPDYKEQLEGITTQKAIHSKIEEIIETLPEEQKELKLVNLPTGIDNSISKFLPDAIYIAAVKDLRDDIKSKESATFGKLLGILMRFLENSEHFETISTSFNQLHAWLNIVRENGNTTDNRIQKIQDIEGQIGSFLAENFPNTKVEIEVPKPELKQIFLNAQLLLDDGIRGSIETKGDGVKRSVTFALLRTYVEQLKIQKREQEDAKKANSEIVDKDGDGIPDEEVNEQPYLFLFEEPELYLHPNAQRVLFDALESLTTVGNQVFVTTHSPMFFSPHSTGTFIKVVKEYPNIGKPFGKLLTVNLLKQVQAKDAFQIICYENNTAAFFSHKVVLVEGDSDLIYLKEVARLLNPEWNFDGKNIPIISINGKSNVKKFIDFYKFFDIKCFCIVDSDALIDGFEKFDVCTETQAQRSALLVLLDKLATERGITGDLKTDKIKELVRRYSWRDKYVRLKEIGTKMTAGNLPTASEILEIEYLFAEEESNRRRQIFMDRSITIEEKHALLHKLRNQDIFILSHGAIESYYPDGITGVDKPTKALKAVEFLRQQEDCKIHLPTIPVEGTNACELEVIFEKIFA